MTLEVSAHRTWAFSNVSHRPSPSGSRRSRAPKVAAQVLVSRQAGSVRNHCRSLRNPGSVPPWWRLLPLFGPSWPAFGGPGLGSQIGGLDPVGMAPITAAQSEAEQP